MPRFAALAVRSALFLCLWSPLIAEAQSAKELLDKGVQALNGGRYAEAVQALDASYRKQPLPAALYNLGLAYKGMGHPDKALEAFEGYVSFADPKKDKQTVQAVRGEIERLKAAYARFALKLTPADATIAIDGTPATPNKNELWVQTGKHRISVRASGYETYEQELEVVAGRFDLEVRLREPSGPPDQRAAALVDAGMALQAAGSLQPALEKYKEAQTIFPTPRATAQMGLTEESLGDLGAAELHLAEAMAARKDRWIRENRARLRTALNRVKAQLATLDVRGTPDGAEVTANERKIGTLPVITGARVAGGAIVLRAKKEGYTDFEETIELPARGKRLVRIDMKEAPPVVAAPVPVVVAPPPTQPVPALPPPKEELPPPAQLPPPEPVASATEQPRPTQSDIESFSDAREDLRGEPDAKGGSATGFEMALNLGYQPWLGEPKLADSSGMAALQILLGARLLWPLSFGVSINGGGGATDATQVVAGLNPGIYVRGHIQREKKRFAVDVWAGSGIQPFAMTLAAYEPGDLDLSTIDPNALDDSTQNDLARQQAGVELVETVQSINIPIELGATLYLTESIGIDLAAALTFWLPQQSCIHDDKDRICTEDGLDSRMSLFIGGGVSFLP